jgi:hypothetical protein
MINLEQVKLLETKVARAIEYVERVTGENAALLQKEVELRARLESYQKRIDELEVLIVRFKEDQGRIEDGILAALDRLNQFENAIEQSLRNKSGPPKAAAVTKPAESPPPGEPAAGAIFFEIPKAEHEGNTDEKILVEETDKTAENGELDIF